MKKNLIVLFLCAIAVLSFIGCTSTSKVESVDSITTTNKVVVVLGKNGVPRPDWVVMDTSTQDVRYAAGYGKMSNLQNSLKKAQAEARNVIAEYVATAVDEIITNYTNDAGESANRQAMDAFETLSKQRAQAVLSGAKQEAFWEDNEGGVWILMSIPMENIASQMYGAAGASTTENAAFKKNDAAVEANNMMNAAIAKYFGAPSVTN